MILRKCLLLTALLLLISACQNNQNFWEPIYPLHKQQWQSFKVADITLGNEIEKKLFSKPLLPHCGNLNRYILQQNELQNLTQIANAYLGSMNYQVHSDATLIVRPIIKAMRGQSCRNIISATSTKFINSKEYKTGSLTIEWDWIVTDTTHNTDLAIYSMTSSAKTDLVITDAEKHLLRIAYEEALYRLGTYPPFQSLLLEYQ